VPAVDRADVPVLPLDQLCVGVARLDAERSDAARSDTAIPTWSNIGPRLPPAIATSFSTDRSHTRVTERRSRGGVYNPQPRVETDREVPGTVVTAVTRA
jgi:hypothetical protein